MFVEYPLCARYGATRDLAAIKTDKLSAVRELTVYQK